MHILGGKYFHLLDTPKRELFGLKLRHSPWINERDKFVEEVVSCF